MRMAPALREEQKRCAWFVRRRNIRSAARYVSPSDALRIVERRRWPLKTAA